MTLTFRPTPQQVFDHEGWSLWTTYPISVTQDASCTTTIVGIQYSGVLTKRSGNFIEITSSSTYLHIRRDKFGSIPLYYSPNLRLISTSLDQFDLKNYKLFNDDVASYIKSGILTYRSTGYHHVFKLLPFEDLRIEAGQLSVERTHDYFPPVIQNYNSSCLEQLTSKFIENIPSLHTSTSCRLIHTSGGNDSSLILSLLKRLGCGLSSTVCTSFGHIDWRSDLDDLTWAARVAGLLGFDFKKVELSIDNFFKYHRSLVHSSPVLLHTYATAFYAQLEMLSTAMNIGYIINGSGPDECFIGTEKISLPDLSCAKLQPHTLVNFEQFLTSSRDYFKLDESFISSLFNSPPSFDSRGFSELAELSFSPVLELAEIQRRFHSLFILQDHIHSITASSCGIPVFFPFLTNDFFEFSFASSFLWLNNNNIYKHQIKEVLRCFLPDDIVHRQKVAFQSPSRAYFQKESPFRTALLSMLDKPSSRFDALSMKRAIYERLNSSLSLHSRYDFLEWNAYNTLLIDTIR